MKIIPLIRIVAMATLFTACTQNGKIVPEISNDFLRVRYQDSSKTLAITTKLDNKVIVKKMIPKGFNGIFHKKDIVDSNFGRGSSLVLDTENGGAVTFTLYPSNPFLFIVPELKNSSKDTLDTHHYVPLTYGIDLGKPVSSIKTLGTGGLLAPDKNPGSYVFLTTVDPATRNGVISGWLTNEKGSGVLFSDTLKGQVSIKPQIDYGHFRLLPGQNEALETLIIGYFDDARLGEEQFADALAKQNNITLRERSAVYCTWYSEKNGGAGSESSSIELAKYIKDNLKSYGLGVIQLDDQWQDGGSYNGPARGFNRSRKVPLEGAVINGTAKQGFPANYPNAMM